MIEISEEGKQLALPNVKKMDTWNQTEDITVSELLSSTQIGKCKVVATIYAIDTNYAWYYFGCELCQTRTYKVLDQPISNSPEFWCEKCNQNVINVGPKFKLHLKVKDDTVETKLILLDWIATPLLGVKADKILDGSLEELEDPEMFLPCIIDVVGKTFKFGVDEMLLQRPGHQHILFLSDESSALVKTPSKRSQYELGDLTDTNSTSKKRPTKSIKVEKMSNEELSLKKSDYRNK
ncbi:hypothetical protein Rs2_16141 [Raphanus sativus]|nr:hypothetical protein Rs2_16141 [Raphanus sativus]